MDKINPFVTGNDEEKMELFLLRVSRCSCGRMEWISKMNCDCGKKYPTDNDERKREQQILYTVIEALTPTERQYLILESNGYSKRELNEIFKDVPKYGRRFDF